MRRVVTTDTRRARPVGLQVVPRCRPVSEPRDTAADPGVELLQRHRSAETPSATARQAHSALAELAPCLSTRSRQVHQILRRGTQHAQAFDLASQNASALKSPSSACERVGLAHSCVQSRIFAPAIRAYRSRCLPTLVRLPGPARGRKRGIRTDVSEVLGCGHHP